MDQAVLKALDRAPAEGAHRLAHASSLVWFHELAVAGHCGLGAERQGVQDVRRRAQHVS